MAAEKRVTLKEIAERTGVSVGTVHCAIYGKKGVSEKTRKMILEEVERCNFQLNENASLLKKGTQNVLIVLPKADGEERFYFRGIWEGIKMGMEKYKTYPMNFEFVESKYRFDEISEELMNVYDERVETVDGLITVSDNKEANVWARRFGKLGIPTVVISTYKEEDSYIYSVKVDHKKAGRLAGDFVRHTLKGKKGRFLVLTGNMNIYSNDRYVSAFQDYLRECCPELELVCIPGFGANAIEQRVREAMEQGEVPLGAFICNARNTIHFCKIMEEYACSKDMVIVGSDAFHELVPYFENEILTATVYQYNREQGTRAVDILFKHLSSNNREVFAEELPIHMVMKYNYEFFVS